MRPLWLFSTPSMLAVMGCTATIGPPVDGQGGDVPGGSASGGSEQGGPGSTTGVNPIGKDLSTVQLDCSKPNVGTNPLRRLTRSEYAHSVRDLLGGAVSSDSLPPDERVGAFPSNMAPVAALDVEDYLETASQVALAATANTAALLGGCDPVKQGNSACADRFIATFGAKVQRRPLDEAETSAYKGLFTSQSAVSFANGIRVVLEAMLSSPYFLYHFEPSLAGALAPSPLDGPARAARLSYLLWGSTPDDALLAAAQSGALGNADGLRAQATRLLADPRARDAVGTFHVDWLGVDELDQVTKDPKIFPQYDASMAAAMQAETARFASYVMLDGDHRLTTLLTAPYSFPTGPLLKLYGVTAPAGTNTPIQLDPTQRAGLLTQPGFLAAHAHANQTSPVQRGKAIRALLFCTPPTPPPPTVNAVAPDPMPGTSTRERFALHTKEATCAACHALLDPIGFGFEHYDAIGAFRSDDGGKPVDAKGNIAGTDDADGAFDGAVELAKRLGQSKQVAACVSEKWFEFAFGRAPAEADACSVQATQKALAATGGDLRELLLALVTTDAFLLQRQP
jgi:hypothetical protein